MRAKLSFYVLTCNSEKYLEAVLLAAKEVADEIIVVDSGSNDSTGNISKRYTELFYYKKLEDFVKQRSFAHEKCTHDWVLTLDSDEIPDKDFLQSICYLKERNFKESESVDSYRVKREWYVMGKKVHSMYPATSPDYVIRLYKKSKASFTESNKVHESMGGFEKTDDIKEGILKHYTFETKDEFERKLHHYTSLASEDSLRQNKKTSYLRPFGNAICAFCKFYIVKRGFKDGKVGIAAGIYAFRYTFYKYKKLMELNSI